MTRHTLFALTLIIGLVASALLIIVAATAPAHAADGTVSLKPAYDQVVNPFVLDLLQGLGSFIVGCAAWIFGHLAVHLPSALADGARYRAMQALNGYISDGILIAMKAVGNAEQMHSDIAVHGAVQRYVAQYVIDNAGGYLNKAGVGPDQLALKVLSYLPPQPPSAFDVAVSQSAQKELAASANRSAVETAPLSPVPKG